MPFSFVFRLANIGSKALLTAGGSTTGRTLRGVLGRLDLLGLFAVQRLQTTQLQLTSLRYWRVDLQKLPKSTTLQRTHRGPQW